MGNPSVQQRFDPSLPTHIAAWRSWRSLKTWVLVWLWYLNAVYWIGFLYLPRPEAMWAIVSYLAIGPFIFALVARQRGLTRLSGLIHLPWVPFILWLGHRLFMLEPDDAAPLQADPLYHAWLHLVFWSTLICLVLDAIDVKRWLAGERYVLGTPAAVAAGASKAATET